MYKCAALHCTLVTSWFPKIRHNQDCSLKSQQVARQALLFVYFFFHYSYRQPISFATFSDFFSSCIVIVPLNSIGVQMGALLLLSYSYLSIFFSLSLLHSVICSLGHESKVGRCAVLYTNVKRISFDSSSDQLSQG